MKCREIAGADGFDGGTIVIGKGGPGHAYSQRGGMGEHFILTSF